MLTPVLSPLRNSCAERSRRNSTIVVLRQLNLSSATENLLGNLHAMGLMMVSAVVRAVRFRDRVMAPAEKLPDNSIPIPES